MIILDGLEDPSISVGRLDKTLSLAVEHLFGSSDGRVNQRGDLESRTELVLESERMAVASVRGRSETTLLTSMVLRRNQT